MFTRASGNWMCDQPAVCSIVLVCGPSDHGAMSVLCLARGGEAVAHDRRVLYSATASNIVAASSNIDRC